MYNQSSYIFLTAIFFCALLGMIYLYQFFLLDIVIAILLCTATFGVKNKLAARAGNLGSTLIVVLFSASIIFFPLLFISYKILGLAGSLDSKFLIDFLDSIKQNVIRALDSIPYIKVNSSNTIKALSSIDPGLIVSQGFETSSLIASKSIKFLVDGSLIFVFMFLFLLYGRDLYIYMLRLLPIGIRISKLVFSEISGVLKVVLFSSLINVILQGLAFYLAYLFLGFSNPVLLGFIYGVLSLVPVVGGVIVWGPVALYLLHIGKIGEAIFLTLYCIIIIAFLIDSIIKPFIIKLLSRQILKQHVRMHEIFIFFAIFAGVGSFGFWGIIIGPALSAFFIAILEAYRKYFLRKNVASN